MSKICLARKTGSEFALGKPGAWTLAEPIAFFGRPLAGYPRRAAVRCLWNEASLYVSFEVDSCRLHAGVGEHDGEGLWLDDGIEILLDPLRQRTSQYLPDDIAYHINILNTVFDERGTERGIPDRSWTGRAEHRVRILGDTCYAIEIAIPWDELEIHPRTDETILGVDFCVNGSHPETGEYDYFDWCGLTVFHDPSGFGDLHLVGG